MSKERSREWRRTQARKHGIDKVKSKPSSETNEKNWKFLYTRSVKLYRTMQLKTIWPKREWNKLMIAAEPIKVLFVCSQNQWRSPTGEAVFRKDTGLSVRSAGTSRKAKRALSVSDIRWADVILVMEEKHKSRIKAEYRNETRYKQLHVLDIPDDYRFMDPELVMIIRQKSEHLIWGE